MYLWSALISTCALSVAFIDSRAAVGGVFVASLVVFLLTALPGLVRGRNGTGARHAVGNGERASAGAYPDREPAHEARLDPDTPASARPEPEPTPTAPGEPAP
jgi:hypothetical protein